MLNPTMIPWNRRYAVLSVILVAVAALAIFTTVVTVSAQSDDPDWKLAPTGLNVAAGDTAGELNIAWDAHPQTSKTLSDYRVTWTPDGEAFKTNDHTEWYAYPTTNQVSVTGLDAGETYKVRVRARYDDNRKSSWSDVATGQAGVTPNSPATAQPTISGTTEVGETLTAGTSSIDDGNGLSDATFTYQWIRNNGSDTDIADATNSRYTLVDADAEATIKVQVSFTDDDGYPESVTSDATAAVTEETAEKAAEEDDKSGAAPRDHDRPCLGTTIRYTTPKRGKNTTSKTRVIASGSHCPVRRITTTGGTTTTMLMMRRYRIQRCSSTVPMANHWS